MVIHYIKDKHNVVAADALSRPPCISESEGTSDSEAADPARAAVSQ